MARNITKQFGGTYGPSYQLVEIDGKTEVFFDYGPSLGSQRFKGENAERNAERAIFEWTEKRLNEITKEMQTVMQVRRFLEKQR